MAKARNPSTFSGHFGVEPSEMRNLGVFDPTLTIDTKLFIDPLLLENSSHPEISQIGVRIYRTHFERVIKLLTVSRKIDDIAWRSARKLLTFHEIKGTCLGYGAGSISGSGFGKALTKQILFVSKEIVDLGITDPDLFQLLALFEEGIGPDRISDMVTNVILDALSRFNIRVLNELGMRGEKFYFQHGAYAFLPNPYEEKKAPIILVPKDILRKLPVAQDWDEIADVASKNQLLRNKVNQHIAHIWAVKTKRNKAQLKAQLLASESAFKALLGVVHSTRPYPYDLINDPDGILSWASKAEEYALNNPIRLPVNEGGINIEYVVNVVKIIIDQFRFLIEDRGLNTELYRSDKRPRHESTSQKLFFAVAYSYCKANNLDISPEIDTGTGKVDFKVSGGFKSRVLVEIKLSSNSRLVDGYLGQLEQYRKSEETLEAFYLVIDVGGMGVKDTRLIGWRNQEIGKGSKVSRIEFVDGKQGPTASKLKPN